MHVSNDINTNMASLQSSSTVLSNTPNPRSNISQLRKPSNLLTNRSRNPRFNVSCSGGGSIDRRNMLLGLGGLYGASNLISDPKARADPLQAPDFKSCDPEGATTRGISLDVNCCPPFSEEFKDYKLPRVIRPVVRRPAHLLDRRQIAQYQKAIQLMRDLDVTDPDDPRGFTQQANIHCAYCNGPHDQIGHPGVDIQIHNSWMFFPFHRWYLYFYERICQELLHDPTFALPFFNWDTPKGMVMPQIFDIEGTSLYDANRNQARRPPTVLNLALGSAETDPAQIISNNLAIMYNETIGVVSSPIDYMGQRYADGDAPPAFASGGTAERGSHTAVHAFYGDPRNTFGEDIGNFYSAGRDPMFFCHHANVDRMWSIWHSLDSDFDKNIRETDFLDATYMFYDEKKRLVRVKASDALDTHKMGYSYEYVDTPWMSYRPPQKAAAANIADLSKGVKPADKLLPITLNDTVRVLLKKTKTGKADETLVLENIVTDNTKLIKFDVFVNDEDDKPEELDRAEYAGQFTQLPHRVKAKNSINTLRLNLKELYENINIADDDTIVITIVPHINGDAVTIGGIKIIPRV